MDKHILVLFDGWSMADEALRYAHALAERLHARLHLLLLLPSQDPDGTAALFARGHDALRTLADPIDDHTVDVDRQVRIGDPWSEFCKFVATSARFDMVVWASETGLSNGRPSPSHWASRIQAEVGCPVVTAQRRLR